MKISIAMCTYNGERYLREQLDSIALQSRLPNELIICDDRSSDKTIRIIEDFASSSSFPVRLFANDKNLGTRKNFEKAIALCEGDLIALSDWDDVWHVEKLELQEALFSSAPDLGLVFSDAEVVDSALRPWGRSLFEAWGLNSRKRKLITKGRALDVLLVENEISGATIAFRSKFKDLVLPIPTDGHLLHDGWIALMIAAVADIAFITKPLVKYRQHPAQQMGAFRTSTVQDVMGAQKTERNYYLAQAAQFNHAYERLAANGGNLHERALAIVRGKTVHLHARAAMPTGRLRRVPLVLKETLNLHYHRYSRGIFSASKDLLV